MKIKPVKNGEISCRNCKRFTANFRCWTHIRNYGHNCKMC